MDRVKALKVKKKKRKSNLKFRDRRKIPGKVLFMMRVWGYPNLLLPATV